MTPRWFEERGIRPLFVEERAVHPDYQGRGAGSFMLDQLQHLARTRGCTHLVLEVAENNESAPPRLRAAALCSERPGALRPAAAGWSHPARARWRPPPWR
ncbi:GNAT family N-acetyltransferase [Corallococcus macrosporus]|uniref:Acetyltransferase n=1 Tax=Corallococcus macrosporus DSM 14697 TaxID=1189310 RepID=A0A250K306_9BACT|nr:GNAT family N-acetyltransferase [Corallococcus macrosporus]ATB50270.1 acetyltransferase [Corallococcus macrosporus DSM 14697]